MKKIFLIFVAAVALSSVASSAHFAEKKYRHTEQIGKEANKTWEEIIKLRKKKYDNNMKDVYQSIIESSKQSRPGVDHMYGL